MDDTYQDECSFCAEIEKRSEYNLFHEMLSPDIGYGYLVKETENFVVMPSIGSLMPGYLLVVPRLHVLSFGLLSSTLDGELVQVLDFLTHWINRTYQSSCIFFEHGSVSFTKRGGSCTDHAHLHVVPVPKSVDLVSVMKRDFATRKIEGLNELREQVKRDVPYLFLRHHDGSLYVCDAPDAKSQHLRRDLVKQLNLGEVWDWAVFPGGDHIIATIDAFNKSKTQA